MLSPKQILLGAVITGTGVLFTATSTVAVAVHPEFETAVTVYIPDSFKLTFEIIGDATLDINPLPFVHVIDLTPDTAFAKAFKRSVSPLQSACLIAVAVTLMLSTPTFLVPVATQPLLVTLTLYIPA